MLDLDIKWFFDNLDHELIIKALLRHTNEKWILLHIERWLKAPIQTQNWDTISRDKWTPQWWVISPLLANLVLHYALDKWMDINNPAIPFERYADDGIYHCVSESQAKILLSDINTRLNECWLELNKEKTRIIYCKDWNRRWKHEIEDFDFLGFNFRARSARGSNNKLFTSFLPAISKKSEKNIRATMRKWQLHVRSDKSIDELSKMVNPIIRWWINYYWSYYKSELYPMFFHLNTILTRWAMKKHKKLRWHFIRSNKRINSIAKRDTKLFAHWEFVKS